MFQNALYRKSCYEISTKHRSGGGVCIFEITGMYLFASACKTHVLHLTKLTNENIKSISRALYKLQVQHANA